MKAIFFEQHGEIDVLRYADLPDPIVKPGEALVRVRAVALNHLDIWVRRGWPALRLAMPHIGGSDIAGEIVSIAGDTTWSAGAAVMVYPGLSTADDEWVRRGEECISPGFKILGEDVCGGLAEYVTVPIQNLYHKPETLSYEEAAASTLVGLTCWRMLFHRAALKPGEIVLVVGSGGGVNSLAVQMCRAAGATVICLARNQLKAARAQALGAHETVEYENNPQWASDVLKLTKGRGVDVVVDNVGKATINQSLRATARGGRIVTVGNTSGFDLKIDNRVIFAKQLALIGSTMGTRQDFIDSQRFMQTHGIKPAIDQIAPLSEGIRMIQHLERGEQFGKIVLIP